MYKGKRFSSDNTALSFLICLGISLSVIIMLSCILALIANTSKDPTGNLAVFSLCALLISGAVSGFITARMKKSMAFVALTALAVLLVMLIACIVISCKISGGALMNYACYMGISCLFGFLGSREPKRRRHRK